MLEDIVVAEKIEGELRAAIDIWVVAAQVPYDHVKGGWMCDEALAEDFGGCLADLHVGAGCERLQRRRLDGIFFVVWEGDRGLGWRFVDFGQVDNVPQTVGYAFDSDEGEDA